MLSSDGYSTENLQFFWNDTVAVTTDPNLRLAQFYLGKFHTNRCDKNYHGGKQS